MQQLTGAPLFAYEPGGEGGNGDAENLTAKSPI